MSTILDEIVATTGRHVAAARRERPLDALDRAIRAADDPPRGFERALRGKLAAGQFGLIAEMKRRSPSHGPIRADYHPAALARAYCDGGAACLSVLTDIAYFGGAAEDLDAARAAVDLPVLRKDFMVDPWQVAEARAIGADAILLILAALDDPLAAELAAAARDYRLDILVEVHDAAELDRALKLGPSLLGINNRDLKTLRTDLGTTAALVPMAGPDRLVVSESGLQSRADLDRMAAVGARCFLVGEALLRHDDVAAATRRLLGTAS